MKRIFGMVAGLALLGAVSTATAEAQGVSFGVGGGLSMPAGSISTEEGSMDMSDIFKNGYHGQVSAQFNPGLPFALRVDGMYHSMDMKQGVDVNMRTIAGVVNAILPVIPAGQVQPYVSAGAGMYNLKLSGYGESESETKAGFNGGAGVRFNLTGVSTFVEGRYHYISTSGDAVKLIPVTVGVMFRR
jgi:opacity protein-like surface antigen